MISKVTIRRITWFWLVFLLGFSAITLPYFGVTFAKLPGDLGDTRFNLYLLEHAYQYFLGNIESYWNAPFMFPEPEIISMSDNLLGTAPIYGVFRLLGLMPLSAFQGWVVALTLLNFWAAYKLLNYLVKNHFSALLGAFVFAFSIGLTAQMNHAQTFPRFAIPLAIWLLLLWIKNKKVRYFTAALALLVYQFYCGIYLGFMLFIPFLALFIYGVYRNWTFLKEGLKNRSILMSYLIGILINLAALLFLFLPYLRRANEGTLNAYSDVYTTIPSFLSYLSADKSSLLWAFTREWVVEENVPYWDLWISPGLIALLSFIIIAAFALKKTFFKNAVSWLSHEQRAVMMVGLITLLIFFRIDTYSLYAIIHKLPGFAAMRSFARVINIELLFFGVAVSLLFVFVIRHKPALTKWAFILFLGVLLVDNYSLPDKVLTVDKFDLQKRHNYVQEKMAHIPKGAVVSYEPKNSEDEQIIYKQIDAMLAAQTLGLKSVNGYSAKAAKGFHLYWLEPNTETRRFFHQRFPAMDTVQVYVVN